MRFYKNKIHLSNQVKSPCSKEINEHHSSYMLISKHESTEKLHARKKQGLTSSARDVKNTEQDPQGKYVDSPTNKTRTEL